MLVDHRYELRVTGGLPSWTQVALVYHGTDAGLSIYYNGNFKTMDTSKASHNGGSSWASGNGKVAIGRTYVRRNEGYASVLIDELMLWNIALTQQQLQQLYNMY